MWVKERDFISSKERGKETFLTLVDYIQKKKTNTHNSISRVTEKLSTNRLSVTLENGLINRIISSCVYLKLYDSGLSSR